MSSSPAFAGDGDHAAKTAWWRGRSTAQPAPQTQKKGQAPKAPAPFLFRAKLAPRLRGLQVHCAGLAALAVFQLVGQALLLFERAHPGGLDGGNMDEGVVAPRFIRDEAVALGIIEKLHGADWHIQFLL